MGKPKQEDPPKGSPAWMATFSDLMNLLLCFFVLLFSMSSVDAEKYELVVQSFQEAFSILPSGGSTVTDGTLVASGISQMPNIANYFGDSLSDGDGNDETDAGGEGEEDKTTEELIEEAEEAAAASAIEDYEQEQLSESEAMAENMEALATQYGIQDQIEVDFNGQYVRITLNGALLFESGSAELSTDALPLVQNISKMLNVYTSNLIDVEGYTDNVPIKSAKYESNDVLSMYRALYVADCIRENADQLDPANVVSTGRGSYNPVADNSTPEGRARNRRVEIKIYNSYNSSEVSE
ncbi:MAG: flagellar motor protein MotB [Lachnospiraceae bacterium]|nr:flagellar motor protein MotB [Lachnospiraceae bacterium]